MVRAAQGESFMSKIPVDELVPLNEEEPLQAQQPHHGSWLSSVSAFSACDSTKTSSLLSLSTSQMRSRILSLVFSQEYSS